MDSQYSHQPSQAAEIAMLERLKQAIDIYCDQAMLSSTAKLYLFEELLHQPEASPVAIENFVEVNWPIKILEQNRTRILATLFEYRRFYQAPWHNIR